MPLGAELGLSSWVSAVQLRLRLAYTMQDKLPAPQSLLYSCFEEDLLVLDAEADPLKVSSSTPGSLLDYCHFQLHKAPPTLPEGRQTFKCPWPDWRSFSHWGQECSAAQRENIPRLSVLAVGQNPSGPMIKAEAPLTHPASQGRLPGRSDTCTDSREQPTKRVGETGVLPRG